MYSLAMIGEPALAGWLSGLFTYNHPFKHRQMTRGSPL